jgi:RNA polymerase sigma-70 factor (ECF subfamily)
MVAGGHPHAMDFALEPEHGEGVLDTSPAVSACSPPVNVSSARNVRRMDTIDDRTIVERIRRQDPGAFQLLYRRYAPYLARVAYRSLGPSDELQDVLQDVFTDVYRGIGGLQDADRLRCWLITIVVRRVRHLILSRRRKRRLVSSLEDIPLAAHVPAAEAAHGDLERTLATLPDKLRIPWVLHRVQEYSLPHVADACSISITTAKRRIAKANNRVLRGLGIGPVGPARAKADRRGAAA